MALRVKEVKESYGHFSASAQEPVRAKKVHGRLALACFFLASLAACFAAAASTASLAAARRFSGLLGHTHTRRHSKLGGATSPRIEVEGLRSIHRDRGQTKSPPRPAKPPALPSRLLRALGQRPDRKTHGKDGKRRARERACGGGGSTRVLF